MALKSLNKSMKPAIYCYGLCLVAINEITMTSSFHKRGAEYMRMSTDVQDLPLGIQRSAIRSYAQAHGIEIITSYEDEGRSGLALHNRPAIKRLLHDVAEEGCSFSVVLYDVSRWGRFQDTGVSVVYVQEPFAAETSPISAVFKSIKRAMAAEFSRQLAAKTTAGQGD